MDKNGKAVCTNIGSDNGNCGGRGVGCSGSVSTCYDGNCIDLSSSDTNCGTCGNSCAQQGKVCSQGRCVSAIVQKPTLHL